MSIIARKPFTFDRTIRIIIGLIILICTGLLVNRLTDVLLPFLVAWLLSYMLYPILRFFQYKLHIKNRIIAIIAMLVAVIGIITLAFYILIPPIANETQKAVIIVNNLIREYNFTLNLPPTIINKIQEFLNTFSVSNLDFNNLDKILKELLPRIGNIVSTAGKVVESIFIIFMVFLYMIFILKDYEKISNGWIEIIPKHYRPFVMQIAEDLKNGMNKYFRGQALIALSVGILFAIGFSIIGLPMGILYGLLCGAMNMVPYLQTIGMIPALMLGAIKAAEYDQNFILVAMSVLAVFAIVQVIEEIFLTPKIMGNVTGLNPAIILLSLSIWGSLLGVVGMIIALPATTLIISYYKRFVIRDRLIDDLLTPDYGTDTSSDKARENQLSDQDTMDS